jgi:hypothetical protein
MVFIVFSPSTFGSRVRAFAPWRQVAAGDERYFVIPAEAGIQQI